jgi:exodeoxyribonuclease VII large subunit
MQPAGVGPEIWTVSEAVAAARAALEDSFASVRVSGEISRFVHHASGHMYFTLKDGQAAISAVLFRGENLRLRFRPGDGMDVLCRGRLTLYEARGQFQMVVSEMEPLGVGSLHLAFEQLKARLASEGLFALERKRALPALPRSVGIATSATGAALRDILRVLERRAPGLRAVIASCRVQGEGAAAEIVEAIGRLDSYGVDVIVVARGGGSLEDLWAFNEESVARAIVAARVPVVTGIGHEIDITIADLAADLRAPTPSAAAEMVADSEREILERLAGSRRRLAAAARLALLRRRERVGRLRHHPGLIRAARRLEGASQLLDDLGGRIRRALADRTREARRRAERLGDRLAPRSLRERLRQRRELLRGERIRLAGGMRAGVQARGSALRRLADLLDSLSPLTVLGRGYALCRDAAGNVVRRADAVRPGDAVAVRVAHGEIDCRVQRTLLPAPEER